MESEQVTKRKLIISEHVKNPELSQRQLAKLLKLPRSTVQRVLVRFKKEASVSRKRGTGRKKGSGDKKLQKEVIKQFKRNPNISVRDVANKLATSSTTVHRIKSRAGLKTFKVQKAANRSDEQEIRAKTRARKLYEQFLTKYSCIVMDDETYCKADFQQLPGQEFYVASDKGQVEERYKIRKISKFPKKYLIWQAICSCGLKSSEFVTTGSINTEIYLNECIKKRLLPFLALHNARKQLNFIIKIQLILYPNTLILQTVQNCAQLKNTGRKLKENLKERKRKQLM